MVVSLFVSKHSVKPTQLASGAIKGSINWAGLGGDPLGELEIFAGMTSPEVLQQRLRDEVGTEVAAMLDAIREFDAFDVIELMRLREIPVAPVLALKLTLTAWGPRLTWSRWSACHVRAGC
jgi:hypothetical protein